MDFEQEVELIPVTKIKIADTEAYSKHPFRVTHDKVLEMLAADIKENGLLNPILVRVVGLGGRYEILSGHRRMEALEFNGEIEAEVRIVRCTDTEAANIVIKSNFLQRDKILPSERAKIYLLRNECLKREKYMNQSAGRTEITEDIKEILSKEFNVSKTSIFEYIRLNNLIEEILTALDEGNFKFKMAVALSHFSKKHQVIIYQYFFVDKKAVLNSKYIKEMKKYTHNLTEEIIEQIIEEFNKPKNKTEKYVDIFVKKYISKFKNEQEMADVLERLLIGYLKNEKKSNSTGDG